MITARSALREMPLVFANFASPDELQLVEMSGKVDYASLEAFVWGLFEALKRQMGWKYARFEKYRYSCNSAALYESNASDAAYLHRDLIPVDDDMVEAYTLVYYADVAQLRIVAGSEHERTLSVRRVWEGVTVKELMVTGAPTVIMTLSLAMPPALAAVRV